MTDLRKDDSIIITKPVKGNGVVIIDKFDYLNKFFFYFFLRNIHCFYYAFKIIVKRFF